LTNFSSECLCLSNSIVTSIQATPHSIDVSPKASAAFGGKNAKGRTTCPLLSEYPASLPLGREFASMLQIAQPTGIMVVQLVKT
jgi:hypothetical protein